jgi:PAS domain S-box-containing protein
VAVKVVGRVRESGDGGFLAEARPGGVVNLQPEQELARTGHDLGDPAQRLQLALAAANLGDWSWDAASDLVTLGRRASAILGLPPGQEITWAELRNLLHPDDRVRARVEIDLALSGHRDYRVEYRVNRACDGTCWVAIMGRALYGEHGAVTGMIGVVQDVTDRRRQEEALRDETRVLKLLNETGAKLASQLDLQALLQAVTDAATRLSGARCGAFFYNAAGERGDGYVLSNLSGEQHDVFALFGQPRATPLFEPTFRGERPVRLDDVMADPNYGRWGLHHGMPEGHHPIRSYLAVPVVARSGTVIGGLFFGHPEPGIFTARTERLVVGVAAQAGIAIDNARLYESTSKLAAQAQALLDREREARAEAERIGALKDEFLAIVSHELRSPLGAILGWAHMLRRRGSQEEFDSGLDVIEQSVQVQTKLIEDLVDMSRITSGQLRLAIGPVEARSFIDAAVETVRPAAEARQIPIRKVLDLGVPPVAGDSTRLQQVMVNLLSNAVKFTPEKGSVEVVLRDAGGQAEITVSDTGIGIAPDFLPHVFDRFRQGSAAGTGRYGGLGLGLAIVKHLVELHGGEVSAASPGEGRGATFTLRLPLAQGAGGQARPGPAG